MANLKAAVLADACVFLLLVDDLLVAWRQALPNIKSVLLHLALVQEALWKHWILVELSAVRHQWRFIVGLQLQLMRLIHLNLKFN